LLANQRFGDVPLFREFLDRIGARLNAEVVPEYSRLYALTKTLAEVEHVSVFWRAEVTRILDELAPEFLARARALDRSCAHLARPRRKQ